MKRILKLSFMMMCFVLSQFGYGQGIGGELGGGDGELGIPQADTTKTDVPDSLILQYFKLSDITTLYEYKDSTLENFFHQYDPAKRRDIDYQNLGNAGSASRNQLYNVNPHVGFDAGSNQYDLYNFKLEDFRFFENNVPHSDVFFTPVGGQENFVIRSDFARSFNDGTSLSLNYRRIRQEGFYTNQLTKTTNFGASLRFQSKNKKYTGFLSIISNVNEEGQNGGVDSLTFYTNDQLSDRMNVDVFSDDAQTRHQQKQYSLINYYQLNKPDSSKTQLLLRYDFILDRTYQKFNDALTTSSADSAKYLQFRIEDRGIKFYNRINRISNALYAYASDGEKLNIRLGLVYDRYDIDQLSLTSGYNNLYADFKGDIPITQSISIKSDGQLGLGDGIGDFKLRGSLRLDIGDWIEMDAGAAFYRFTPDLMSRSLIINTKEVWNSGAGNDFTKPVGSDLFGSFSIPKLRIKGKIKQSLVTNAIYYDESAVAQSYDGVFSATSINLSNTLKWRSLGMENYLMFQVFNDNIYRLPTLFTKHNLHIEGRLFKKVLLARLGTEFRFSPTYTGADYSPVVGSFFQTNDDLAFYPQTDVYITGKLQKFRFFLRFENVVSIFSEKVQYQIANYPQFDYKLRFGVSWLLIN